MTASQASMIGGSRLVSNPPGSIDSTSHPHGVLERWLRARHNDARKSSVEVFATDPQIFGILSGPGRTRGLDRAHRRTSAAKSERAQIGSSAPA